MPRSALEKLWLTVGGIAALLLLLVGWFFFIGPQRSKTSDVRSQISSAQLEYTTLQSKLAALRAQSANIGKYKAELAAARQALPSSDGIPAFLRTLQALGNATMTQVSTVTVGAPAAVVPPAPTTEAPTDTSSSAAPSPTDSATTSTTTPSSGIYSMPITAQVTGATSALAKFLEQLQSVQPRAILITQITESAGSASGGKGTSLQLSMQAFVDPTTATVPTAAPVPSG